MAFDDRLLDLLIELEDRQVTGRPLEPADVCRECPEQLAEVERCAVLLREVRWLVRETALDSVARSAHPTGTNLREGAERVSGYRLLRRLGRGGFGEVWEAEGPGGFPVAFKIVPLAARAGPVEMRALEVIKGVGHPHLLGIHGAWLTSDSLCIAMELAEATLHDRLEKARAQGLSGLPPSELLSYLTDAAEGLDHLNGLGVLHRDIKPQNLLLVGGGVKVGDFGLAKLLPESGHSGSMTPAFAAPEFFAGNATVHSDQYSLAVAYCLLRGGRLPFTGDAARLMAGHLHGQPDLSMVSEVERPVLTRALAKDPEQRWPDNRAFARALRRTHDSPPTQALAVVESKGPEDHGQPPRRRFAHSVALLSLAGSVVVAGAVYFVLAGNGGKMKEPNTREPLVSSTTMTEPLQVVSTPIVGEVRRLRGHGGTVLWAAFLPDGHRAVSAGSDHTVRLWNVDKSEQIAQWSQAGWWYCLSPDGRQILCSGGDSDPTPTLRRTETGELLLRLTTEESNCPGLAFLPDGKRAVTGSLDGTVRVWNLETGAEIRRLGDFNRADLTPKYWYRQVWSLAVSEDGNQVLAGVREGTIRLFEIDTGKELHTLRGHRWLVNSVCFSPDGKWALSGNGDIQSLIPPGSDKTVRLWDLEKGKEKQCFGTFVGGNVWRVAFSNRGDRAVTVGEDGSAVLWEVASGQVIQRWTGHAGAVHWAGFSKDGQRLITAGADRTVRIWEMPSKETEPENPARR